MCPPSLITFFLLGLIYTSIPRPGSDNGPDGELVDDTLSLFHAIETPSSQPDDSRIKVV